MQPAPGGPGGPGIPGGADGPRGPMGSGRGMSPLMAHHQHPLLRVVIALVVIAALAALVAYLVVRLSNRRGPAPMVGAPMPAMAMSGALGSTAALDQLRMRYARGDVSRADYLQAAADLGAPVPDAPPPPTNPE